MPQDDSSSRVQSKPFAFYSTKRLTFQSMQTSTFDVNIHQSGVGGKCERPKTIVLLSDPGKLVLTVFMGLW